MTSVRDAAPRYEARRRVAPDAFDEIAARLGAIARRPPRDQRFQAARVVLEVRRDLDDRRTAARMWRRRTTLIDGTVVLPHDVQDHLRVRGILGVAVMHEVRGAQVHLDIAGARHAAREQHRRLAYVGTGAATGATAAQHGQR